MRTLQNLVRQLLASIALIGILVGPPIALWQVGRHFLPDRFPSAGDVLDVATRPDDGRLFLGLLVAIGIGAWLVLACSIVLEAAATALRRPVLRVDIPGFGWGRSIAAALITATLGAGATPAFAAPLPALGVVRTEPADLPATSAGTATIESAGRTYDVKPRDTLWRIAEKELGDPLRWREIYQLNVGRPQTDGEQLTEASMLHSGWRLVLPSDTPISPTADVVTVGAGESLTQIAADRLGDPSRATEIYDGNRGHIQPDGGRLTDPDLLHPGWQLTLPGAKAQLPTPAPRVPPPAQPQPEETSKPARTAPPSAPPAIRRPPPLLWRGPPTVPHPSRSRPPCGSRRSSSPAWWAPSARAGDCSAAAAALTIVWPFLPMRLGEWNG